MNNPRAARFAGMVGAIALLAGPVRAGNLDFAFDAGAAHTDNIDRLPENGRDEDIGTAGLKFSFDEKTRKLSTDLVGSFEYLDYRNGTYDPELVGNFSGDFAFDFVPERFSWTASDHYGQVLADPFLPATPANRENINFFSTGPDVHFALGTHLRMSLAARYLATDYQDSPFDSDTVLGEIGISHELNGAQVVSLFARHEDTNYAVDNIAPDYQQAEAFLRYAATGVRTQLSADGGYSRIERDNGGPTDSTALFRLTATRLLATGSNLTLRAGHEFANSGSAFAETQAGGRIDLNPGAGRQSPNPFLHEYASLLWSFVRHQTTFTVSGSHETQQYNDQPLLDQRLTTIFALYRRDLSPITSLQFDISHTDGSFDSDNAKYTDLVGTAAFDWGLTRRLSLSLSYQYAKRDGDARTGEYEENRIWLTFSYRHGAPRQEMLRPEYGGEAARY